MADNQKPINMNSYPEAIKNCIAALSRFPGVGPKSAERMVFYLLKRDKETLNALITAINNLKKGVAICQRCFNVAAANPCSICSNNQRDQQTICVVAEPQDVSVIEKTGDFRGLYHVLGGTLNSVEGITPEQLTIKKLIDRVTTQKPTIREIIIATNPDLEGESTAMYLARQLKTFKIKITRLAKGLPMGSDLEYADEITVSSALKGRQVM